MSIPMPALEGTTRVPVEAERNSSIVTGSNINSIEYTTESCLAVLWLCVLATVGKQKTEPHLLMKFRFKGRNNESV